VQLSAPEDYDGGQLELRDGDEIVSGPRDAGTIVAFPSWVIHRVTPVTRGLRRSLVVWVGGPPFR
jgi:PKHD-type hydroxylase